MINVYFDILNMIDTVKITVRSGKGGDGSGSFRREKFVPKGGPDGGDGGDGGSVYLIADPHKNTLSHFRGAQAFIAENGGYGGDEKKFGAKGSDTDIAIPLGTIVWEIWIDENGEEQKRLVGEILEEEDQILVARGGLGGRGNVHFKSSRNTTPLEYELGGEPQERTLLLELKLLADIGLVGYPNAGKSTLLSVLTKATPKIANYPFTTLNPHLGVLSVVDDEERASYVLADIPGLIEEASVGKGLGYRFLKHIERCRVLVYVLFIEDADLEQASESLEFAQERVLEQWQVLRGELKAFNPDLLDRPAIVLLNKIDTLPEEIVKGLIEKLSTLAGVVGTVLPVSGATQEGLETFGLQVHRLIKTLPPQISRLKEIEGDFSQSEKWPVFGPAREANRPTIARKLKP